MDFIIDRTNEDVAYAQSFVTQTWSKMTNEQREEWLRGIDNPLETLKGFFNWRDMTRIKLNYNSLISTYSYSGEQITTNYTSGMIPNRTTMTNDFIKIRDFATSLSPQFINTTFSDYRVPTQLTYYANKLDYNFVNNIEHLLKNLYDYNANGELIMECEFLGTDSYELDGFIKARYSGEKIEIKIPSGYIATREVGTYNAGTQTFTPAYTNTWKTNSDEVVTQMFSSTNKYANLKIASGITSDNYVIDYGTSGNSFDVTNYDTVRLDSDLLRYSQPTTYTATEIQSDMIDVSSLVKMYCYDISVYGESTIVTLYDENEDMFDEVALREDTEIDLTNASYITFDTDIDTEITYITSDGTSESNLIIQVGSDNYTYPNTTEFDVSEVSTIKVMQPAPHQNKMLIKMQKSIIGGKDLSQLDLSEIEVKYI